MASTPELIEALERAAHESASGTHLLETLERGLSTLRRRYRRDPSPFGERELARLGALRHVSDHVGQAMELMERATYVQDAAEYESLQQDLRGHAADLGNRPVGKSLLEQLRKLPSELPAVQAEATQRRQAREARILQDLETNAARCQEGHPMKLRRGRRGPFWGCSEYPRCRSSRDLSSAELASWSTL